MAKLRNLYGYFSDDGREFVITRPDTPTPWINILSNGDFGMALSQAGSGYTWRTHASLNRITRWEQDLVRDEWGKYLYIRDAQTGDFWSPTWQPCKSASLESYLVRHGWGYSVIESVSGTLESRVTYFVPLEDPCEIWLLRLENTGGAPRRLQVFSYLEWLLGAAPDWHREFHKLFIDTRYETRLGVLLATKVLWDLPVESLTHWNRPWPYVAFHSVSLHPDGFDSDKWTFLGIHGSPADPIALRQGRTQNTQGRWGDAIGSLQVSLELPPGVSAEVAFVLGASGGEDQALEIAGRYKDIANVHAALVNVQRFWNAIPAELEIDTPDEALNLMANGWLQYQAIAGRLWGRSAYYQTGGAFGFRDQLQDSLVWLLLGRPENTLAQIRLHAAHQYQDGVVLHWWHPLAETGLRSEYSDDLLWLPFVVLHYLYETGDFTALDEAIRFFDGGSASLLEHCLRAFQVALSRRSSRGLPLILKGDWNDGLNAVGAQGRGESVWMAHFLYYLLTRWAELPVLDDQTRAHFRGEANVLRQSTEEHAWDGAWYWRATTDSGSKIGSDQNTQGRIFLNPQTWSVLSGLASEERARQAMDSARRHLYQPYGALLLRPAYSLPDAEIGYLSRYAPGARENGGVYIHAACWAVMAERQVNGVEAAYRLWRSFCPPLRSQDDPDAYMAEPYVMPGNVDGPDSPLSGRGAWTWYTGSSGWYLRALVEAVLGIQANLDGLRVTAGLPEGWDSYQIKRRFRGVIYNIRVRRAEEAEEAGTRVDGQPWREELLPILERGTEHEVEILI